MMCTITKTNNTNNNDNNDGNRYSTSKSNNSNNNQPEIQLLAAAIQPGLHRLQGDVDLET